MATTAFKIRPLWHGFSYFPHQIDGIQWMLDREINGTEVIGHTGKLGRVYGGLQCDEMGLGKTIQIASAMFNNPLASTLVIAPLAMINTWSTLLQRIGFSVYEVRGRTGKMVWERMDDSEFGIPRHFLRFRPSVFITNYEKMNSSPLLFNQIWGRIVLDEGHKIRNGGGLIAKAARKLVGGVRWVVTGTPLVNSFRDVVTLLAFLGVAVSKQLRWEPCFLKFLPLILMHRSLDSLRGIIADAPPVPEIYEVVLPFETEAEEDFYYGVQGATESMTKKYSGDLLDQTRMFLVLLRLRQISVHPQVYINARRRKEPRAYGREDWGGPSTKLVEIRRIIEHDDESRAHKYIVFCQFMDEMNIIGEYLSSEGIIAEENVMKYSGEMSYTERNEVLEKSKASCEKSVLLIQLQAGGVGLNLQEYDRVIFMSPWWTAALMDQAIARAVRMGQREVVKVYHLRLEAEDTKTINIDKVVSAKAMEKRAMLEKLFKLCT
jgi:SNF2 family DNA or RNA helicase